MAENPYAAPTAAVADVAPQGDHVLAGRGDRLLAAIVDGIAFAPASVIFMVFYMGRLRSETPNPGVAIFAILYALAYIGVQIYMLHRSSQSIGKKVVGIKIARKDGSRPSVWRIVLLRNVIGIGISWIPLVGSLYSLVDILFIFGEPRRCVHDFIADTIVIQA